MTDQTTIYTIGYQGRTVNELQRIIEHYRIEQLVDVRSKPYGRQVEFNRKALEAIIPGYLWMGDRLGGFAEISDQAIVDLAELAHSRRVMIMCMERAPGQCHRTYEIAARLLPLGISAVNL